MDEYDFANMERTGNGNQQQQMDSGKKGPSTGFIILIVAIILGALVVISAVGAGFVFLWSSSFEESTDSTIETMNIRSSISSGSDELKIEIISGQYDWSEYKVMVDGVELTTSRTETSAGDEVIFTGSDWDAQPGTSYNIKVIQISEQKTVWEYNAVAMS